MSGILRSCLGCGRLVESPWNRCPQCRQGHRPPDPQRRRYDYAWRKLRGRLLGEHLAVHGRVCMGFKRPPHPAWPLDLDHIVSRDDGGTDDPANLAFLCRNCNRRKGARDGSDPRYATEQISQPKRQTFENVTSVPPKPTPQGPFIR